MNSLNTLFVYGTLQKGQPGHILMRSKKAESLGEARLPDYALYGLGPYPGIKPLAGGCVLGEIYRVSNSALVTLDRYEHEGRLFLRRKAPVQTEGGGDTEAWIYIYLKDVQDSQRLLQPQQPWGKEKV